MEESTKVCRVCGAEKALTEFRLIRDRGREYYQGKCRDCYNTGFRAYYAQNPERRALQVARTQSCSPRSKARGLKPMDAQAAAALMLSAECCTYCKQPKDGSVAFTVDHVVSVKEGGTHDIENLVACCEPCNRAKLALPVEVFMAWLRGVAQRLAT